MDVLLQTSASGADQVFTYTVPDAMRPQIRPGIRVVVPLGRRDLAGIVLTIPAPLGLSGLRPIEAVLDTDPILPAERLQFVDWLSSRYLCRRSDVWRLFFPPGVVRRGRRQLTLAAPWEEVRQRLERFILPPGDAGILLAALKPLTKTDRSSEQMERALGLLYQQVRIMLGEGYLAWREPWQRPRPGAKKTTLIRLGEQPVKKITPKQQEVLDYLAGRPDQTASMAEILAACGAGRNVVDRMAAMGCLLKEEAVSRRVPREREQTAVFEAPELYPAQRAAVDWLREHLPTGGTLLLHGVTGSGKTEVYLQALSLALAAGRQGLLLVPEIGLTPQIVERAAARFGDRVAILHSKMSVGERVDEWSRVREGEASIVIGPRSALFAPLPRLGVVILDEEHDQAYKQEEGIRYHAREVAATLAGLAGAVLILGSATPSLESMGMCERGEAVYHGLPERAGGRSLPPVELVDLREEIKGRRTSAISRRLQEELGATLEAGKQAILLLNRRGYATFVICRECGYAMRCPHCDVSLTYHQGQINLICHYCGHTQRVPDTCPSCRGRYIRYFGLGTERLYEETEKLFPGARVARMDQDSMSSRGAHQEVYRALRDGTVDILIGTQMVAKGLDLPRVTMVGVVAADSSLNRPDFRAAERTFQLLTQVAGRAGRGDHPGKVVIQTYNPGHYSLVFAASHDYGGFYAKEREVRLAGWYPPFAELARFGLTGPRETELQAAAEHLAGQLKRVLAGQRAELLGPTPALVKRVEDRYRYHILLKTETWASVAAPIEQILAEFRQGMRNTRIAVVLDVNPNTVL